MTERTRALRTHGKKSAKHLPLLAIYGAYESLHVLTLLSTLAPLALMLADAPMSRDFDASLSAVGFVVKGLHDGSLPCRPAF